MERLTKTDISMAINILSHPQSGDDSDIRKAVADAIEAMRELQRYKDLEEQGRLIELPCKVGDTVYCVSEERCKHLLTTACWCEGYDKDSLCYEPCRTIDEYPFTLDLFADFGKTVFLTKEEAEAKLKGGVE